MLILLGTWGTVFYILWTLSMVICLASMVLQMIIPGSVTVVFVGGIMLVSSMLGCITLVLSKIVLVEEEE